MNIMCIWIIGIPIAFVLASVAFVIYYYHEYGDFNDNDRVDAFFFAVAISIIWPVWLTGGLIALIFRILILFIKIIVSQIYKKFFES